MLMTVKIRLKCHHETSLLDRFFGPLRMIPEWIVNIHKSSPMDSIDCLPDNVLSQILLNINSLQNLLNSSLVSRRWYDLSYWRFAHIRHLIGKSQDNCFHSDDLFTLAFNPSTTNITKLVKALSNIRTILIENQSITSSSSTSNFEIETSSWDENVKGFELRENLRLILRESAEPSLTIDCDFDATNEDNSRLMEYYSHLIDIHGESLETLVIFTLELDQVVFLKKYLINQLPMKADKARRLLTICIPSNSHHFLHNFVFKCPNLRTLYYLVKDSSRLLFDQSLIKHRSLENLILEFWVNQDSSSRLDSFVEMFPNLRQLIVRDNSSLTDDDVYRILPKLGALESLDVRGCPRITVSSEMVIVNAQRDLPHRVNYFFGPYQRINWIPMDSKFLHNFIFNSWLPGSINPFDLYSCLRRDILASEDGREFV